MNAPGYSHRNEGRPMKSTLNAKIANADRETLVRLGDQLDGNTPGFEYEDEWQKYLTTEQLREVVSEWAAKGFITE